MNILLTWSLIQPGDRARTVGKKWQAWLGRSNQSGVKPNNQSIPPWKLFGGPASNLLRR